MSALPSLSDDAMRRLRLAGIALVPQGSMHVLNPVLRIRAPDRRCAGRSRHGAVAARACGARARSAPARWVCGPRWRRCIRTNSSGGMKQRACIAIAICLRPKVIIADEPTSALDVVVQRQVMATLGRVQQASRRGGHAGRPRHGPDGAIRRSAGGDVRRAAGGDRADRARSSPQPRHPYTQHADRQPAVAGAEGQ